MAYDAVYVTKIELDMNKLWLACWICWWSLSLFFLRGGSASSSSTAARVAWDSCNMQIGACHAAFRQLKSR